jgi:hypothetical protein
MNLPKGLAIGMIVAGILGIVAVIASGESAREYVKKHYKRAGERNGAQVYTSTKPPLQVAKDIEKAHKPADRRVTSEGVFLRYRKDFIGVFARGKGTSIEVADENRGYHAFYPFIGGWWGTYSGPGETFRGGGPGGGGK